MRTTKLPLTIKIVVGFWSIFIGLGVLALIGVLFEGNDLVPKVAWSLFMLFGVIYQTIAISRMSRWSLLCHTVLYAATTLRRFVVDPNWMDRFPLLGVFVDIIPWAFVTIMIAVHWQKMNWAPLGLPYIAPKIADDEPS